MLRLPTTAYRFAKGHRIRLAVAASYWPLVWPTASDPGLRIIDSSRLFLPTKSTQATNGAGQFPAPRDLPHERSWTPCSEPTMWRTQGSGADGRVFAAWLQNPATIRFAGIQKTVSQKTEARFEIAPGDFAEPKCEFGHTIEFERPDGKATVTSHLAASGTNNEVKVRGTIKAIWNQTEMLFRPWGFECELNRFQ